MALVLDDRVKETSTTTGTGTLNLSGAVSGFQTFVAGVGDGNTTYYAIINRDEAEWETGVGTVTDATTDTLARTTVAQRMYLQPYLQAKLFLKMLVPM